MMGFAPLNPSYPLIAAAFERFLYAFRVDTDLDPRSFLLQDHRRARVAVPPAAVECLAELGQRQIGDPAGADRADIARLVAHRVEHGLIAIEDLLVAADPKRQLPAPSAARPAADR